MSPTDDPLACVTSFLWDAHIDAEQAARRLDAATNRLRDAALANNPHAHADADKARELRDRASQLTREINALYDTWAAERAA